MADESRSLEDEILALIIVHEPLLRHIIGLGVDDPSDREDIYQETVVAILENFRKGTPVEHPKAWMVRIAKNKCIDFHRRDKRDTNRDIDFASIISPAAFGGGVSIADDQHQAKELQHGESENFLYFYTSRKEEKERFEEIPRNAMASSSTKCPRVLSG